MEQVEITSGGDRLLQLDERLVELDTNVYGSLSGDCSATDSVLALRRLGWSVRKASWLTFGCAVEWCEIVLAPLGDDELNLAGVVDPARLDDLAAALAAAGLTGHLELYDPDGRLTRTVPVTSPVPPAA